MIFQSFFWGIRVPGRVIPHQACLASGMVRSDLKHGAGALQRSVLEPPVQAALKEQGPRVQLDGKGLVQLNLFYLEMLNTLI